MFFSFFLFSFFSAFVDVLVCGLMCVMVLIAALFVSLGFQVWCSEMTRRFETCSDAMGNPIDKVQLPSEYRTPEIQHLTFRKNFFLSVFQMV